MRWLCFLFASATAAQGRAVKPLRFDLELLPVTRDSFTFFLDRKPRGFAVWQYETRSVAGLQEIVYSAYSEFLPVRRSGCASCSIAAPPPRCRPTTTSTCSTRA